MKNLELKPGEIVNISMPGKVTVWNDGKRKETIGKIQKSFMAQVYANSISLIPYKK